MTDNNEKVKAVKQNGNSSKVALRALPHAKQVSLWISMILWYIDADEFVLNNNILTIISVYFLQK